MLEYARWKYALAFFFLLAATIYSLPNLYPQDPAVQISANRGNTVDAALKKRVEETLEKQKISFKQVDLSENGKRLLVRLGDTEAQLPALETLRKELGDGYTAALNLASTVPPWLVALGARPMTLGLDLQGGVHFLMEMDRQAALNKQFDRTAEDLRGLLRTNAIRHKGVTKTPNQTLTLTLAQEQDRAKIADILAKEYPHLEATAGASAADSYPLVIKITEQNLRDELTSALEQNVSTLRNRINALGVAEPIIQRQGESRIVVQLPGVQDTAAAKKLLGATATLEYRAVDMRNSAFEATSGNVPPESKLYYKRTGEPILLSKRIIVSGDQLLRAEPSFDQQTGEPIVSVRLNGAGAARMEDFTRDNVGNRMAVVYIERIPETTMVDGKEVRTAREKQEVISDATIQGVFGRNFQTTGLARDEASELALLLRSGSLVVPIDIVEERIIGPSLGRDNIERGWKAVTFSFLFVLAFFLVYYKMFGLVANLALILNLLLVVAVMSVLGATLTLPGLAGIALTVGMSVDANVLINERIREELRLGNSPQSSIAAGYDKAAGTIADANITALLAGIALFAFGTGPIKGFAVSLCVGILTSMYTAVSVSRAISTLIYGGRRKVARLAI